MEEIERNKESFEVNQQHVFEIRTIPKTFNF